jgi:hypothetical protein
MAISHTSKNHIYGTENKFHVYKTQVKKVKPSSTKTASDKSERKEEKRKRDQDTAGAFLRNNETFWNMCCTTQGSLQAEREIFNSAVPKTN